MTDIRVQLDGLTAVNQALRLLAKVGEDLTPLMRQAAAIMASASEDAFQNEASPEGAKWAPLAPATVRKLVTRGRKVKGQKRRKGGRRRGEHPILQVTGRLAASVTTEATATTATIGSNLVYAALQQFGQRGRHMRPPIPARPYIGLGPAHLAQIEDAALALLHAKVRSWLPRA